jgi:hypothetical protein
MPSGSRVIAAWRMRAANRAAVEAVARRLEATGYLDRAAIDELLKTYPVRRSKADPSEKDDEGRR